MTLYRVWCRFEPNHFCNLTGRRGQWRVTDCAHALIPMSSDVIRFGEDLGIASTKPYRKGCIIRPHRELNRVLAAKKGNV